uniref:Thrombospondin type 1 domain protein n=1 Tax=Steinernema glaseri TaxID=37863 RepID=A0A1I7ZMG9_9BILA
MFGVHTGSSGQEDQRGIEKEWYWSGCHVQNINEKKKGVEEKDIIRGVATNELVVMDKDTCEWSSLKEEEDHFFHSFNHATRARILWIRLGFSVAKTSQQSYSASSANKQDKDRTIQNCRKDEMKRLRTKLRTSGGAPALRLKQTPCALSHRRVAIYNRVRSLMPFEDAMFASSTALFALLGAFLPCSYGVPIGQGVVPCPVCQQDPPMGFWSQWTEWSQCTQQYGAFSQSRSRTCSSTQCPGGDGEQARPCTPQQQPPEWSQWGQWGQCSASCGGGVCTRQRVCDSVCNVCPCVGVSTEQKPCNTQPCNCWSEWSPWSGCSITCGIGGFRSRTRQCNCAQCPQGEPASQQEPCDGPTPCPYQPPPACDTCQQTPPPCQTCVQYPPPCVVCGRKKRLAMQAKEKEMRLAKW